MNRIDQLFNNKKKDILSIYFTAGHPTLDSTADIIKTLEEEGVDLIEIGIPFSDPVADGPVIQKSSQKALENGMKLKFLFHQLHDIRKEVGIPLILMGYFNPILQYGIEKFCASCSETGIDGTILPDLPVDMYEEHCKNSFERHNLHNIFLATPQTSNDRFHRLDSVSRGFLYMVAASSITGARSGFEDYQQKYFERISKLNLKLPRLIGFGISSHETFTHACQYASGAIIGSAFVNVLEKEGNMKENIGEFIHSVKGD